MSIEKNAWYTNPIHQLTKLKKLINRVLALLEHEQIGEAINELRGA
jgi:hypothetical protein